MRVPDITRPNAFEVAASSGAAISVRFWTRGVILFVGLLLAFPQRATAQVLFNNGAPDYQNVFGTPAANDFALASSATLSSFDVWIALSGSSGPATTTDEFFWAVLRDADGSPGSTLANGIADAVGAITADDCCPSLYHTYRFNVSLGDISLGAGTYWLELLLFNGGEYWATSSSTGNQFVSDFPAIVGYDPVTQAAIYASPNFYLSPSEGAFLINGSVTATPEPATLTLTSVGLIATAIISRRRKRPRARSEAARSTVGP
jgi:hypothetical protein